MDELRTCSDWDIDGFMIKLVDGQRDIVWVKIVSERLYCFENSTLSIQATLYIPLKYCIVRIVNPLQFVFTIDTKTTRHVFYCRSYIDLLLWVSHIQAHSLEHRLNNAFDRLHFLVEAENEKEQEHGEQEDPDLNTVTHSVSRREYLREIYGAA